MATKIEVTKVDEAAAQRLADATGKVTYLSQNPWLCMGQSRMTTDRDEAVAWGESVAFVPQQKQSLPENKSPYWHGKEPVVMFDVPTDVPWKTELQSEPKPDVRVYRKGFDGEWKEVPAQDTVAEDVRRAYLSDSEPPPQLRVVRVLEYRGPQDKMEAFLAHSAVTPLEPFVAGGLEIVEQIRTTERLCRWCGGEHLGACSEEECSGNERKGRY